MEYKKNYSSVLFIKQKTIFILLSITLKSKFTTKKKPKNNLKKKQHKQIKNEN